MQQINLSQALKLKRGGLAKSGLAGPVVTIQAKNVSGGTLNRGDTVVMSWSGCTADLLAVTTTTSGGDTAVAGMVLDVSLADTAIGEIQVYGPTKFLKVDGTTDIAVGDALGTFTTAKIAAKVTTAGRFARALEAYSTNDSSGVIDAFITCGLQAGMCFTTE